jgi:hypothetical protein
MGKQKPRKTIVAVGKRLPTNYEIQKDNRQKAIQVAENTPDEIKKPTKYDLKR